MFGLIVTGRLVQTDFVQADPTHFIATIPEAESINHIVVFLTGQQAFPEALAGAVYFSYPQPDGSTAWQYLGYLSNEKPSAIFRVSKFKPTEPCLNGVLNNLLSHTAAQIGISVEPLEHLKVLTPAVGSSATATNAENFSDFVQKMMENFVNYSSSFAVKLNELTSANPNETYLPFSAVQRWYETFSRRLAVNPYFWRS